MDADVIANLIIDFIILNVLYVLFIYPELLDRIF